MDPRILQIIQKHPELKSEFEELYPELKESEDERIRKALLRCCDDWEKGQYGCMNAADIPSIRAYLERQKPTKWSEEDEAKIHFLKNLIQYQVKDGNYCFGHNGKDFASKQEAIEMLLSLRPQPEKNWRRYIWNVNMRFDYGALVKYDDHYGFEIVTAGDKPKREVNGEYIFLKDICSTSYWKPSEEQMYILNWVANTLLNHDSIVEKEAAKKLQSLYNDLQKLL